MIKTDEKEDRRFWVLSVAGDEVFARVSSDSSYREHAMQEGGERLVLLEDDRALFDRFFRNAVAALWLELARMSKGVDKGAVFSGDAAEMRLEVSDNHEANLLPALDGFVADYLDAAVLREWYLRCGRADLAAQCTAMAAEAVSRILTVVHYRKRAVKRPINPIF